MRNLEVDIEAFKYFRSAAWISRLLAKLLISKPSLLVQVFENGQDYKSDMVGVGRES